MNKVRTINQVFLMTVIVSLVGSELIGLIAGEYNNYFVLLLISQILLILPMVFYIKKFNLNIRETIRFKKIRISNIILIILFAYLIMPLMTLINLISQLFATNVISDSVTSIVSNNPFVLSLFVIAFVPCILEESVYRGVFYNEYRKINPIKGIFLSAFLFGLLHMNFNQFSYAFAMGIVFALLIEATDSILSSMIVHFVINGNSVLISYITPKLNRIFTSEKQQDLVQDGAITKQIILGAIGSYIIMAFIATILALIVYIAIAKNSGRFDFIKSIFSKTKKGQYNEQYNEVTINSSETMYEKKKLISIPLVIGMLGCLAVMIIAEIM